jgi:hypothetical protein
MLSGEWTDGAFPVLDPRAFKAEHEREQPENPRHRRLISEDNPVAHLLGGRVTSRANLIPLFLRNGRQGCADRTTD